MKTTRILALLMALATLFAFAGCSAKMDAAGDLVGNQAPSYGNVPEAEQDAVVGDGNEELPPENPFVNTVDQNVSTFSADVDTASYSYFRKLVNQSYSLKQLKNSGSAFRTEEFINYFRYTSAAPAENELFGVGTEIIPCPWNSANVLMRLTLQAEQAVPPTGNNLVFLIDVSGSMNSADKLPLLQRTFSHLVGNLTAHDVVSIVTYSGNERVVLQGCPGNESARIMEAINSLTASGSTNGEAGLSEAYRLAETYRIEGGNNRIIMASDGDLNVGISSASQLKSYVETKRDQGVYLSILGFGTGNYRDSNMEALADNGNGVYYYIDGDSEAEKVFGTDLLGTLYTVAQDVKLQISFDENYVAAYRLIGYENRLLNQEDFEDDTKDAGEVGAGHQVTVCYELTLKEGARTSEDAWMKLAVRYKDPGQTLSQLNEYSIGASSYTETVSQDMAFLSALIRTVMILRQSQYLNDVTFESVIADLNALDLDASPDRAEFRRLLQKLIPVGDA